MCLCFGIRKHSSWPRFSVFNYKCTARTHILVPLCTGKTLCVILVTETSLSNTDTYFGVLMFFALAYSYIHWPNL